MKFLSLINSVVDGFSRLLAYLAGALILAIAGIQIVEIASRNLLGASLSWVWEYAPYFHMSAVFMAAAFTLRTGGHIRVTAVMKLHPRLFELIATVVALCISAFLSYSLTRLAADFGASGRTSGTVTDTPLVYPGAVVAMGSLMLTFQLMLRLLQTLLRLPEEIQWGQATVVAD